MRIAILLLVSTLGLVAGCGQKSETSTAAKQSQTAQASSQRLAITTVEVTTADVPVILETVGEVQSKIAPEVDAEIPGRVIQLLVDVGDAVTKGQPLARLDKSSIELERDASRAEQRRLTALVSNQESIVKRYHELAQSSFVSKNSLDEVDSQLTALREQLTAAQARLAVAEDQLAKTTIVAPIDGVIDARQVAVGDYVKDGVPIFKMTDTSALRVTMVFPEPALLQLRIGTPLKIRTAVDYDKIIPAAITEIRPLVETMNKGVVAYADLKNSPAARAGASAYVQAILAVHKNSLVVPQLSVVRRPAGEVVYFIGTDNKAAERVVRTGARFDDKIEILSGLAAGERVAVDGAGFLTNGAAVDIKQN